MVDAPVIVNHERLADFIASVLEAMKMSPKNARLSADLMVRTDLRGVDSHGIGMLPKYVEWTDLGFIDPGAEPTVKHTNTGHCFAAIDIKRFRPLEEFTADMDDLLGTLQDMPTAEGHERVYTAGQPEAETERHRRATRIPVAPMLAQPWNDIAARLGVAPLG